MTDADGAEQEVRLDFAGCHHFVGESELKFDEAAAESTAKLYRAGLSIWQCATAPTLWSSLGSRSIFSAVTRILPGGGRAGR
ncbi:MAG TPA: hypothetical protein VKT81_07545 [Bryobacteraceae bacterium]|nr:hypothetical protein [Bryobacteraceae bacterium]